jgi:hypothetical protein
LHGNTRLVPDPKKFWYVAHRLWRRVGKKPRVATPLCSACSTSAVHAIVGRHSLCMMGQHHFCRKVVGK